MAVKRGAGSAAKRRPEPKAPRRRRRVTAKTWPLAKGDTVEYSGGGRLRGVNAGDRFTVVRPQHQGSVWLRDDRGRDRFTKRENLSVVSGASVPAGPVDDAPPASTAPPVRTARMVYAGFVWVPSRHDLSLEAREQVAEVLIAVGREIKKSALGPNRWNIVVPDGVR